MNERITKRVLVLCLSICVITFCIVSVSISPSVWLIVLFLLLAAVSVYFAVVSWQATIRAAKAKDISDSLNDMILRVLMQKDMERTAKDLGVSEEWLRNLLDKS